MQYVQAQSMLQLGCLPERKTALVSPDFFDEF
jgi:hypothetical protein